MGSCMTSVLQLMGQVHADRCALTCSSSASLLRMSWMLPGRLTLTVAVAADDAACQDLQTWRAAAMDLVSLM